MTEMTLSPAEAMAERVLETVRKSGHLDVAPKRQAAAKAALASVPYPTTRDERWKYTRASRLQKLNFHCANDQPAPAPEILPAPRSISKHMIFHLCFSLIF